MEAAARVAVAEAAASKATKWPNDPTLRASRAPKRSAAAIALQAEEEAEAAAAEARLDERKKIAQQRTRMASASPSATTTTASFAAAEAEAARDDLVRRSERSSGARDAEVATLTSQLQAAIVQQIASGGRGDTVVAPAAPHPPDDAEGTVAQRRENVHLQQAEGVRLGARSTYRGSKLIFVSHRRTVDECQASTRRAIASREKAAVTGAASSVKFSTCCSQKM